MTIPVGVLADMDECVRAPLVHAAVTKLLNRAEVSQEPRALEAVDKEARALIEAGTWLETFPSPNEMISFALPRNMGRRSTSEISSYFAQSSSSRSIPSTTSTRVGYAFGATMCVTKMVL